MPGKAWTDAEIARLRQLHASGMRAPDIAATLGRSTIAIKCKCEKLRILLDREQRSEIARVNNRKRNARDPGDVVPSRMPAVQTHDVREATIRFELAFCDWADRHPGIEICPYEATV
jgi:hypothetical protein